MDDFSMLCLFGLFMIFVLLILPRFMNDQPQYDPRNDDRYPDGGERPRNDDPRIQGRGSFGRPRDPDGGNVNFPWVNRRRDDAPSGSRGSRPGADNPNVSGRGSFGRDKDR